MSSSLCPGLDPCSPEKRLQRGTKVNFYLSLICGCSGSEALPLLGTRTRGADVTRGRLCLQSCILPGEERKETLGKLTKAPGRCRPSPLRKNIHQSHLPLSIPGNPPRCSGWRQSRLCYRESLQTHEHVCASNSHRCSSWTQKCLSALDEAKAQIAISHDSPGIDLALRRQQGSKVESVRLRGP